MYYSENNNHPLDAKNEAEDRIMTSNPNVVLMHPNLVFGDYTYFVRYLTQSVLAGKIHKSLSHPEDRIKYFPVHMEDLTTAITHALENFDKVKGNSYSVKGSEDITLSALTKLIEKSIAGGKKTPFTNNLGIGNFIGEFVYGLSHDKNMCLMAEYFRSNFWEFTHDKDYFMNHGIKPKHEVSTFFQDQEIDAKKFVYPLFSGYKHSELD